MTVTIRDVARRLGISISAVSRALDGYPDISEGTRQRVIQTAREMGYVPNRAAQQLRRKRADAIGYILPADTPRFADPFYAEFLSGLGDETACHPFDLLVSIASPGAEAEQHIYENWAFSRKVDGFVLNHLRSHDWRARFLTEHNIPFVTLEHAHEAPEHPCIEVNNSGGMVDMVAHLFGNGFRRLAFVGGPEELVFHAQRLAGFRLGLEQAGLPFDPGLVMNADLSSNGGYQAASHMRWVPDPPDAIVCVNDETAFGVLHAVHEMGLRPGIDLAVTGFDGVQASQHTDPPLTTLDIPVYEIARQLVRLLVSEINHQPLPAEQTIIQPRLVIRQSSRGRLTT